LNLFPLEGSLLHLSRFVWILDAFQDVSKNCIFVLLYPKKFLALWTALGTQLLEALVAQIVLVAADHSGHFPLEIELLLAGWTL
jgi:hypothetical protein